MGLFDRFGALQPYIAKALFDLWEPHLAEWQAEPGPYLHLTYGFRSEVGWDDAMLSVKVENWRVKPMSLDD